jgi:hypothetical protein
MIALIARQKIEEQRGLVEAPGLAALASGENIPEQLLEHSPAKW